MHRVVLAVGPKRSEYFARLFGGRWPAERADAASHLELEGSAADAFPVMLDYLYSADLVDCEFGAEHITAENVVALRHLAQYFQIPKLFALATDVLRSKICLDPESAPTFLVEATSYGDERLANASVDECAKEIRNIGAAQFEKLPSNLFAKILSSEKLSTENSKYMSHVLVHYCKAHRGDDGINEELFAIITEECIMPEVDKTAALPLLEIITELSQHAKTNAGIMKIQARCIYIISSSWTDFADLKETEVSTGKNGDWVSHPFDMGEDGGNGLPDKLQIECLKACLYRAKKRLEYLVGEKNTFEHLFAQKNKLCAILETQAISARSRESVLEDSLERYKKQNRHLKKKFKKAKQTILQHEISVSSGHFSGDSSDNSCSEYSSDSSSDSSRDSKEQRGRKKRARSAATSRSRRALALAAARGGAPFRAHADAAPRLRVAGAEAAEADGAYELPRTDFVPRCFPRGWDRTSPLWCKRGGARDDREFYIYRAEATERTAKRWILAQSGFTSLMLYSTRNDEKVTDTPQNRDWVKIDGKGVSTLRIE